MYIILELCISYYREASQLRIKFMLVDYLLKFPPKWLKILFGQSIALSSNDLIFLLDGIQIKGKMNE